jgi:hypothetical protein
VRVASVPVAPVDVGDCASDIEGATAAGVIAAVLSAGRSPPAGVSPAKTYEEHRSDDINIESGARIRLTNIGGHATVGARYCGVDEASVRVAERGVMGVLSLAALALTTSAESFGTVLSSQALAPAFGADTAAGSADSPPKEPAASIVASWSPEAPGCCRRDLSHTKFMIRR